MRRAVIVVLLLGSHVLALQVGVWIARPSAATAVAQLVAGDRPYLVAGIAGLAASAGDQWRRWQLAGAQSRVERLQTDLSTTADVLAGCRADLGMSRHAVDLAIAAHDAAVAGLEIERNRGAQALEALYAEDEDCGRWAALPVCPGVLRLRDAEHARDRAAGRDAAAGGADNVDQAAGGLSHVFDGWRVERLPSGAGAAGLHVHSGSVGLGAIR